MLRMRHCLAALALFGVSACGGDTETPEAEPSAAEAHAQNVSQSDGPTGARAPDQVADTALDASADAEARPAAAGAPDFAVIYPGGVINQDAEAETGQSGPGGIVTYVTTASPDAVIAFHRARAEAEGLASVMAMNQGGARAYGAHSTASGANLSVFATPGEQGGASVQLVWSSGG